MSKIKWGAIVVDGRGKLGGHVFTKTKSGATMRTKVTPVNPQTSAQAAARSRLGGNSQAWAGLSEDQRRGWNALASETSKTNIFGDQYFPSGKNLFTSVNNNLVMSGNPSISNTPIFGELPFIVNMMVEVDTVAKTMLLDIELDGSAVDMALVIEASQPSSPGKFNFAGSYRQIAVDGNGAPPHPATLWDSYVEKFGKPSQGRKVSFRAYYISTSAGNASPRFSVSAIAG
jgi:hypothetical protein